MTKPRPDKKLGSAKLSKKAQDEVFEKCETITLREGCEWLALPSEMGGYEVEISQTTLSKFLGEVRTVRAIEAHRERLKSAAAIASGVEALSTEQSDQLDQVIVDGLKEWLVDGIINRNMTEKGAKALLGIIHKDRQLDLDERKLALLEKKAAAFDQIEKDAEDDNLTPEERLERIRKGLQI